MAPHSPPPPLINHHSIFWISDFDHSQFSSAQLLSCVWLFATPWRLPWPSPTPGACSNSCPSRRWCPISSSVVPFFSCLQSFPASGSFPGSQLFTSGGQSIGVSASASVLPMNIQDWFPLGWTGWISLQSRGLLLLLLWDLTWLESQSVFLCLAYST